MNKAIKHNWYWFLIGAVVASTIVCGGIAIKASPTKKEKILFYISALEVNTSALVKESKEAANDDIRLVRINHESVTSSENSRLFGLVYDSTDIYIYPESQLERTTPLSAKISEDNVKTLLPNAEGKEIKEECAIKVYDATTDEGCLKSIIDYRINENQKENYYLSFFKSSLHIGALNNHSSDNALRIANYLLKL